MKKIDWKKKKGLIAIIAIVGLLCVYLVAAEITPSLNLNGFGRFTITNYSSITGIGNFSVGSGTNYIDIYSDGSTNIFDTLGYSATFTDNVTADNFKGNVSWTYLNTYPVACPANSYVTQLDDTVTCTTIEQIVNLNVTSNFTLPRNNFPTCTASLAGNVRYNTTSNHPMYCNTTSWVQI